MFYPELSTLVKLIWFPYDTMPAICEATIYVRVRDKNFLNRLTFADLRNVPFFPFNDI